MRAEEEKPLIEVERAGRRVREGEGVPVGALQARPQGVERCARLAERGQRLRERARAGGACRGRRLKLDVARPLDQMLDGDGVEGCALCARSAAGLRLVEQLAQQPGDAPLDQGEVLAELPDRPAVGRRAEALLLLA